jgi:hypothetical protein
VTTDGQIREMVLERARKEMERTERLLEYGFELAIRTGAPVTVLDTYPSTPWIGRMWLIPAGARE